MSSSVKRTSPLDDLYKSYRDRLLAFFVAKRIDRSLAEDYVHDVFLRYQKADYALDDIQSRVALFRIASNVFIDHLRRERTKRALGVSGEQLLEIDPELDAPSDAGDPSSALEAKQELSVVLGRLRELPPKCREVFIDFRFRNLSQKEIATRRGISVSMVEKHVALAISRLKTDGET